MYSHNFCLSYKAAEKRNAYLRKIPLQKAPIFTAPQAFSFPPSHFYPHRNIYLLTSHCIRFLISCQTFSVFYSKHPQYYGSWLRPIRWVAPYFLRLTRSKLPLLRRTSKTGISHTRIIIIQDTEISRSFKCSRLASRSLLHFYIHSYKLLTVHDHAHISVKHFYFIKAQICR